VKKYTIDAIASGCTIRSTSTYYIISRISIVVVIVVENVPV